MSPPMRMMPKYLTLMKLMTLMIQQTRLTGIHQNSRMTMMTLSTILVKSKSRQKSLSMRRMPKYLTLMKLMTLMIQQTRSTGIHQNSRMTMMTLSTVLVKSKSRQKNLSMRTKKLRMQMLLQRKMRPQLKF
jgi:hypothetical protein